MTQPRRTTDVDEVRAIIPDERIMGLLLADWMGNTANVALTDGERLAFFMPVFPGIFAFGAALGRPWADRPEALAFMRSAMDTMFSEYGAKRIVACQYVGHAPSERFSRALGFTASGCPADDGELGRMEFVHAAAPSAASLLASHG